MISTCYFHQLFSILLIECLEKIHSACNFLFLVLTVAWTAREVVELNASVRWSRVEAMHCISLLTPCAIYFKCHVECSRCCDALDTLFRSFISTLRALTLIYVCGLCSPALLNSQLRFSELTYWRTSLQLSRFYRWTQISSVISHYRGICRDKYPSSYLYQFYYCQLLQRWEEDLHQQLGMC